MELGHACSAGPEGRNFPLEVDEGEGREEVGEPRIEA